MKNYAVYRLLELPSIWHLFLQKKADVNLCSCGTIGALEGWMLLSEPASNKTSGPLYGIDRAGPGIPSFFYEKQMFRA